MGRIGRFLFFLCFSLQLYGSALADDVRLFVIGLHFTVTVGISNTKPKKMDSSDSLQYYWCCCCSVFFETTLLYIVEDEECLLPISQSTCSVELLFIICKGFFLLLLSERRGHLLLPTG